MSTSPLALDRRLVDSAGEVLVRSSAPDIRRKSLLAPLETKDRKPGAGRYAKDVAITSEHIDGDGDIVRADGLDVDSRYRKNPVVLLQHGRGMEFPVIGGSAVLVRGDVDGKPGWIAKEWLFGDTVLGREINSLWNDMILRTTSIGFRPTKWHPIDKNGAHLDTTDPQAMEEMTGFDFTQSVLHEFSVVAMPSNVHASREFNGLLGMKAASYFDLGSLRKACTKCAGGEETHADALPKSATRAGTFITANVSIPEGASADDIERIIKTAVLDRSGLNLATTGKEPGPDDPGAPLKTDPEPIARVAQILKAVSLERCPGCSGVNLYSREAGSFLEHRSKGGPRCETRALKSEPCGPTVKTIADGIRERTRDETRLAKDLIPADSLALIDAMAAIGDVKSLPSWTGAILKELGDLISKAGRVLSAETRQRIETGVSDIETSVEAMLQAIDTMRGAARLLREYLAAADREDTEPEKGAATIDEAQASPADGLSVDDQLRDPQVQAALAELVAAT